jgi:hypothetical protein
MYLYKGHCYFLMIYVIRAVENNILACKNVKTLFEG